MANQAHVTSNARRQRSWQHVSQHYHARGWESPYVTYQKSATALLKHGATVLDVGCGRTFPSAAWLIATGARVYGIDPVVDPAAVIQGVSVDRGTSYDIPHRDGSIDLIVSQCVLEHLARPATAFAEFRRVLKEHGQVLFLTANKWDYVSLFALLVPNRLHKRLVRRTERRDEGDTFSVYYRANTAGAIADLAAKSGFGIDLLRYLNQFPYAVMFSPLLCRAMILYDRIIGRFRPLHCLRGWLLGLMTKRDGLAPERH
jgi:SAM-dependent methyltransferase